MLNGMGISTRVRAVAPIILVIGVILVAVLAYAFFTNQSYKRLIVQATYFCADGKSIIATYYQSKNKSVPKAGQPPTPNGSVSLDLSNGRSMVLPQTISADGVRYANANESIVFWNKGNGVTFVDNGQQTYTGCIEVAKDPGGLPNVYENSAEGFSIRYPVGYTVDNMYKYQEFGPGKDIDGVKFTIPASVAKGTNLVADSYVSVEQTKKTRTCIASSFLNQGVDVHTLNEDGMTYSVASSTGAGAGNRYEETVYALPGTSPCIAIRYFIHYGVIQNYPEGMVHEFNAQILLAQFDAIRRTLILDQ